MQLDSKLDYNGVLPSLSAVNWKSLVLYMAWGAFVFKSQAQGTIYLSNLGESGAGFSVGGGNQSFVTGTESNGYSLNSITFLMGNWVGNASNFNASIWSDNSGQAGIFLGALSGNNDPQTAGQYTYYTSSLYLNPNTTYWIVATCDASSPGFPLPPGGYTWQTTLSQNYIMNNGWSVGTGTAGFDGAIFQFAVNASPVPEPSVFLLLGLATILLCRRKYLPGYKADI